MRHLPGRLIFLMFLLSMISICIAPLARNQFTVLRQNEEVGWEENTIYIAAKRYVLDHGAPSRKMGTNEVKQELIPFYLNRWPSNNNIDCSIDNDGNIHIESPRHHSGLLYRFESRFYNR